MKTTKTDILFMALATLLLGACKSGDDFSGVLDSGSGGTGTASIAISSFSPGQSSVVVKADATQQFLVSAEGEGTLRYTWTLDGATVGINSASFILNASLYGVGTKVLKVTINDSLGTLSQEWSVKINGTPAIGSSTPAVSAVNLRQTTALTYSVNVSDPNNDTLTYVWKLNGQEDAFNVNANTITWTPTALQVGQHTIAVDIYDGTIGDGGTYKITRSWTTYVNNFEDACNAMENESQTNKTCVFVGIAGIGDGLDPLSAASSILMRPAALAATSSGGLFIADDVNHVIWYWNKEVTAGETILGTPVPYNKIKVVAGAGWATSGLTGSLQARRQFFNNPHGLHYDGTHLYVADASNNRVVRFDNDGNGTGTVTATAATLTNLVTGCNSPRGLAMLGTTLYVACNTSHIVRTLDTGTLAVATFAGTGAEGDPANMNAAAFTASPLRGPYGVAADANGNIWVSEYSGCRVRFYNRASNPSITLYGTYVVNLNQTRIALGTSGSAECGGVTLGEAVDLTGAANARVRQLRNIRFNSTGHLLMTGDNMFATMALDVEGSAATVMGTAVTSFHINRVFATGANAYIGEGLLASASRVGNHFDIIEEPVSDDYFVADNAYFRLRKIKVSDNKTALIAGNGSFRPSNNSGQGQVEAGSEKMNQPRGFAHDTITGQIFIADSSGHRIRMLNRYGEVSQAVGTGVLGSGGEEDEFPTNSSMNQPRGMVLTHKTASFGGHLVWTDSQNHRVRIWNRGTANVQLFGVNVSAGKVATIGGNGSSGNAISGSALVAAFNQPSGVAVNGPTLYIADRNNHCIKSINSNGDLAVVAGLCGTAGNNNGAVGIATLNLPEGIDYYSFTSSTSGTHTGLLIASTGATRIKFHRLSGSSLLFGGSIAIGDTNSILCGTNLAAGTFHTEGVGGSLAVCAGIWDVKSFGEKICFVNSDYHNVRCTLSDGAVSTVMGSPQGIENSSRIAFPGMPWSSGTYDPLNPNPTNQNGITAFSLPAPLDEPELSDSVATLNQPRALMMIDAATLLVADLSGTIRKVKLP